MRCAYPPYATDSAVGWIRRAARYQGPRRSVTRAASTIGRAILAKPEIATARWALIVVPAATDPPEPIALGCAERTPRGRKHIGGLDARGAPYPPFGRNDDRGRRGGPLVVPESPSDCCRRGRPKVRNTDSGYGLVTVSRLHFRLPLPAVWYPCASITGTDHETQLTLAGTVGVESV